jgi:hypothetical protein
MTEADDGWGLQAVRRRLAGLLQPGERERILALVVPVAGVQDAGIGGGLARMGALKGPQGSVARRFEKAPSAYLLVTDRRLALIRVAGPKDGFTAELPRSQVVRVEKRPRTQVLARFRMHFADGSSADFMTFRAATVRRLQAELCPGR